MREGSREGPVPLGSLMEQEAGILSLELGAIFSKISFPWESLKC